jgi:hypothetical protein
MKLINPNKPTIVSIAQAVLLLRLLTIILGVVLFAVFRYDFEPGDSYISWFMQGMIDLFELKIEDMDFALGQLTGKLVVPSVLTLLAYLLLRATKYWPTLIVLAIDLMFGLSAGMPVLTIAVLVLLSTKPAREFLQQQRPMIEE